MKRILALCIGACMMNSASAAPGKVFFGAGAGMLFPSYSGNNSIGTGAGWPDDSYNSHSISDQPFFFLTGGYTWMHGNSWFPYYSAGLRYSYLPTTTIKGSVDQYSLPDFNNYNYQYDISLLNILATFKLDLYRCSNFMPYVIAGAGITNYGTSNYKESATANVTPRVSPGFSGNSSNNFSYLIGVGVDYILREDLWLNLEYDYNDYGTIQTGNGANYATLTDTNYSNESLKNSITGNTLSFGVTYYIG